MNTKQKIVFFDDRRDLIIPGDNKTTIRYCTEHFIHVVNEALKTKKVATVALSGGSTPKAIFEKLASPEYKNQIDWNRVLLFWSDERCVLPKDPESNYKMAMDAGFSTLSIPPEHIFRMEAEENNLDQSAKKYEEAIQEHVLDGAFDLIMLGMGDDGHTASLFPKTHGLHVEDRLTIANFIPQKDTWRMTFTFPCINQAHHIAIYVLGKNKAAMVKRVLIEQSHPDDLPIQRVGTRNHKALWIADEEAASEISCLIK